MTGRQPSENVELWASPRCAQCPVRDLRRVPLILRNAWFWQVSFRFADAGENLTPSGAGSGDKRGSGGSKGEPRCIRCRQAIYELSNSIAGRPHPKRRTTRAVASSMSGRFAAHRRIDSDVQARLLSNMVRVPGRSQAPLEISSPLVPGPQSLAPIGCFVSPGRMVPDLGPAAAAERRSTPMRSPCLSPAPWIGCFCWLWEAMITCQTGVSAAS